MLVKATKPGFLLYYREQGDIFECPDEQAFHDSWMVKVDEEEAQAEAKPKRRARSANEDVI